MSNPTLDVLNQHMSIRSFTDEMVSDQQVSEIIRAATAGPNMNNYQPVTFIEITSQDIKADITTKVGMKYIETAARYFVVTVDYNKDLIGLNNEQRRQAEENIQSYALLEGGIVSAGIALGRAQVAAESLGLGSVTMAGALGAFEIYEEHLNLLRYVKAVMGFSIGHPADNPGIKPKLGESGFLMKDRYNQVQLEEAVSAYNKVMVEYYANRGIERSWTENNARMLTRERKTTPLLTQYAKDKGFNLK